MHKQQGQTCRLYIYLNNSSSRRTLCAAVYVDDGAFFNFDQVTKVAVSSMQAPFRLFLCVLTLLVAVDGELRADFEL